MKASLNKNLHAAKTSKKDEFYTQLPDIERELKHYKDHFKDKVVLCNCDDPRVSNFFHYFSHNFEELGLKKLITTCYKNQNRDLFSQNDSESAIYLEYYGDKNGDKVPNPDEIGIKELKGDGDFRSEECTQLLKEADIVVTNPPFSLFREYVEQLTNYDRKFVVVGNKNAISYKETFKLIRENRAWVGNTPMSVDMLFDVPDDFSKEIVSGKREGSGYRIVDGVVKARAQAIWFTNLDHAKRHEKLILYKSFNLREYPKYDNYNAIEVSKVADIPLDYFEPMGVPVTFLDKYNPEQFEILGITDRDNNSGLKTKEYTLADVPNPGDLNRRAAIKTGDTYKATYARLLIRRK